MIIQLKIFDNPLLYKPIFPTPFLFAITVVYLALLKRLNETYSHH